jgi:hypothetical protein
MKCLSKRRVGLIIIVRNSVDWLCCSVDSLVTGLFLVSSLFETHVSAKIWKERQRQLLAVTVEATLFDVKPASHSPRGGLWCNGLGHNMGQLAMAWHDSFVRPLQPLVGQSVDTVCKLYTDFVKQVTETNWDWSPDVRICIAAFRPELTPLSSR